MSRRTLRALPVFWQLLAVLLAAVIIAQGAGIVALFVNPPPRPQFNRLDEIAETLAGDPRDVAEHDRDRDLLISAQADVPKPHTRMVADAQMTHSLAERLNRADAQVRLYFEPDRPRGDPFRRGPRAAFATRHGETLFFTPLIAAVQMPQGWRVVQTPPPPLIAAWQQRMITWLAISVIAMIPLAWAFARALTRPISSFAAAADRLGADPLAPAVAEEGPAELRIAAHALNRMQSRLADYVGERTRMIGAIAHDLRTPLARIAFRIEDVSEPVREKVLGDVEQMRAMLAATIGFVRSTEEDRLRVNVDLAALVTAMVDQDHDLGRDVRVGAAATALVSGDPLALERLLQNLIDNGLAYGGAVEAIVRREDGVAVVTIADRGPGMAEELLERAFQPFVRGDPSRNRATGGIGLGLTIARTIAENHGGTVTLANRVGGGLEAVLRLPLAS